MAQHGCHPMVPGPRQGFQAVAQTYVKKGRPVLVTTLSHYTESFAVEEEGGVAREIRKDRNLSGSRRCNREDRGGKEGVRQGTRGSSASSTMSITSHGNIHDIPGIARVAHQYSIPVVYNGAYTVGILPVMGRHWGSTSLSVPATEHGGTRPLRHPRDDHGVAGRSSGPRSTRRRDKTEVRDQRGR